MGNVTINHWNAFATLCSGKQSAYYKEKISCARECSCVSFKDVFTKDEVSDILSYCRLEKRQCYMNATRLAMLFPDRVKYVEGEVAILNGALSIEHAWNLVDGVFYVDLTFEHVLGEDVTKLSYVSIGAYDVDTIRNVAVETGVYGGVFNHLYIKKIKNNK